MRTTYIIVFMILFSNFLFALPGDWWGTVKYNDSFANDKNLKVYLNNTEIKTIVVGNIKQNYYLVHIDGKEGDKIYFKLENIISKTFEWSDGDHHVDLDFKDPSNESTSTNSTSSGNESPQNTESTTEKKSQNKSQQTKENRTQKITSKGSKDTSPIEKKEYSHTQNLKYNTDKKEDITYSLKKNIEQEKQLPLKTFGLFIMNNKVPFIGLLILIGLIIILFCLKKVKETKKNKIKLYYN